MRKRLKVAAAVTVAGLSLAGGLLAGRSASKPMCARQPSDGGSCFRRMPDGGAIQYGPQTVLRRDWAGECEVFECGIEP